MLNREQRRRSDYGILPEELSADVKLEGYVFEKLLAYKGGEAAKNKKGFSVILPANTGAVAALRKK